MQVRKKSTTQLNIVQGKNHLSLQLLKQKQIYLSILNHHNLTE